MVAARGGRRRKKKGPSTGVKLPEVFPTTKCKLRLLKLQRIKVRVGVHRRLSLYLVCAECSRVAERRGAWGVPPLPPALYHLRSRPFGTATRMAIALEVW